MPNPHGRLKPNRAAVSASEVMNQSIGFRPAAVTRTRICPQPACGTGTSRMLKASGPPNDSNWTARLVVADVLTLGSLMLTCLPERLTEQVNGLRFG